MAKKAEKKQKGLELGDYRHGEATRKNNPPAKIAAEGVVPIIPKAEYHYSPRRPPVLRFDPSGGADALPELLAEAKQRPLTDDELRILAEALRDHEPWLEWAEKREQHALGSFEVDPVALHIHERISTQAIVKMAARQDVPRTLFADPEQEYHEAVQFYKHDIDWTNRLILGDSLQVMSSLARREDLAGKVQMIYMDPPYGIKFGSNFQPEVGRRDVKDRDSDLTREPEMVKAYRDTWHLGVHSYLSYLRDRLMVAKELLADTGSIFVQIGEENKHRVRLLLEEVFGPENHICDITYKTSIGLGGAFLDSVSNYIIWFARNREKAECRYRQLYRELTLGEEGATRYGKAQSSATGEIRVLNEDMTATEQNQVSDWHPFTDQGITSRSGSDTTKYPVHFTNKVYYPTAGGWRTGLEGMKRVLGSERVVAAGTTIRFKKFFGDFGAIALANFWADVGGGIQSREDPKVYVVQTATNIVQRCMLMATDPGDLVLDPTCGGGTTAYVAEQWGRRWITMDTSRVAIALARQRILTAKYEHYRLRDEKEGVAGNFVYKSVPHITLRSIAQNEKLDPLFEKHEPILDKKLTECNTALKKVTAAVRKKLLQKLMEKEKAEGKRSIKDSDERRWKLPGNDETWEHWTVPFDTDSDYPAELQSAVTAYRKAWRSKMDEVNACIAASADPQELVDKPEIIRNVVRVSGPFTVEAVQPPEMSLGDASVVTGKFDGDPEGLDGTFAVRPVIALPEKEEKNREAYLDRMTRLLRTDGVRFPDNRQMVFSRLDLMKAAEPGIHAEGRWIPHGEKDDDADGKATACIAFGPQYGPVTAKMVEDVIRSANRMGYDDLVVAGFTFDGTAQAVFEEASHSRLRIHMAHIRPDVNPGMNGLLKETPGSQLFTVFGQPRTRLEGPDHRGEYRLVMEGVDIYNPVDSTVMSARADKVAAWFLDSDYDGRTFCITQAFFPDRNAWSKLAKSLKDVVDEEAFEAYSGTESLPFRVGKHKHVAVKVIDPRGNEVMKVHEL